MNPSTAGITTSRRVLTTLLALLALAPAASAQAATTTHFASPTGTGDCLTATTPCPLPQALTGLASGDIVSLATGSYDLKGVATPGGLQWVATDPTAPRPDLITTATGATALVRFGATSAATFLTHIAITDTRAAADQAPAIELGTGASLELSDVSIDTTSGQCVDASAPAVIDVNFSTLKGQAQRGCLTLPVASNFSHSTISSTGLSVGFPPAALTSSGVVEDSTVNGGLFLADPGAVARRDTVTGGHAIAGEGTVVDSLAISGYSQGAAISADERLGGTLTAINDTAINTSTAQTAAGLQAQTSGSAQNAPQTAVANHLVVSNTIVRAPVDVQAVPVTVCSLGATCVSGQVAIDHSNFVTTSGGPLVSLGAGNQSADPLFANVATGDYHLRAGSPAIDAGTPLAAAAPTDLDGAPRNQGPAPDLGAYETTAPPKAVTTGGSTTTTTTTGSGTPPASATAPLVSPLHLTHTTIHVGTHRAAVLSATVSTASTVTIRVQRVRGGHTTTVGQLTRTVRGAGKLTVSFTGRVGALKLKAGHYRFAVTATDHAGRHSAQRVIAFTVKH